MARVLAALTWLAALAHTALASLLLTPAALVLAVGVTDLVNLVRPAPDVYARLRADPWTTTAIAAVATFTFLFLLWVLMRRSLRSGLGAAAVEPDAHPPRAALPAEHELANVVIEAAIAAGVPPPRVLVGGGGALVAYGRTPDDATLVIGRDLLDRLDRRQTRAAVAHQIASIADGDLRILTALVAVPLAYAVPRRVMMRPFAPTTRRQLAGVLKLAFGRLGPVQEADLVLGLLDDDPAIDDAEFLPVMMHATFMSVFWLMLRILGEGLIVGPMLTWWVRRRRYLADAGAVQLTREPSAVAEALVLMARSRGEASHRLGAVEPASVVPLQAEGSESPVMVIGGWHPATRNRLKRLEKLGAVLPPSHADEPARGSVAWSVVKFVLLLPVLVVLLGLMLALTIALALYVTGMFYVVPAIVVLTPLHLWSR